MTTLTAVLTLVVCLADAPDECREVTPHYQRAVTGERITLMECAGITGQVIAQRWLAAHPGYVLRAIRCQVAGPEDRAA